jgi:hypothetical protein
MKTIGLNRLYERYIILARGGTTLFACQFQHDSRNGKCTSTSMSNSKNKQVAEMEGDIKYPKTPCLAIYTMNTYDSMKKRNDQVPSVRSSVQSKRCVGHTVTSCHQPRLSRSVLLHLNIIRGKDACPCANHAGPIKSISLNT